MGKVGKAHRKLRATALRAACINRATLRNDERMDDGQAKARALSAALARELCKALKRVASQIVRKARARIADFQQHPGGALLI